jgi:hypothetical protein
MKVLGNPFGYVANGAMIGMVLGFFLVRGQRFAVNAKTIGMLSCVAGGALIGYAIERFVSRRRDR